MPTYIALGPDTLNTFSQSQPLVQQSENNQDQLRTQNQNQVTRSNYRDMLSSVYT